MKAFIILAIAVLGCFGAPKPEAEVEPEQFLLRAQDFPGYPYGPFLMNFFNRGYNFPPYFYPGEYRPIPEPYFEPAAGQYVYPGIGLTHHKEKVEETPEKEEMEKEE